MEYYFLQLGHQGKDNSTTQVYTYLLGPEEYLSSKWIETVPFDLVHHPLAGSDNFEIESEIGLTDIYFDLTLLTNIPF